MNLTYGKRYHTRSGKVTTPLVVRPLPLGDPDRSARYPYVGKIDGHGCCWTCDGRAEGRQDDIVAEYVEDFEKRYRDECKVTTLMAQQLHERDSAISKLKATITRLEYEARLLADQVTARRTATEAALLDVATLQRARDGLVRELHACRCMIDDARNALAD